MSGRLPYHVNQIIVGLTMPDWDMPPEMTAMPKKMKQGGCAYSQQPVFAATALLASTA